MQQSPECAGVHSYPKAALNTNSGARKARQGLQYDERCVLVLTPEVTESENFHFRTMTIRFSLNDQDWKDKSGGGSCSVRK